MRYDRIVENPYILQLITADFIDCVIPPKAKHKLI